MPAPGTPLSVAAAKAGLRRRIGARRAELVAAGRTLAAPLRVVDRCLEGWRALPPLARVLLSAAGSFAATRLLRSPRGRTALGRLLPVVLGWLGRAPLSRP